MRLFERKKLETLGIEKEKCEYKYIIAEFDDRYKDEYAFI